MLRRRSQPQMSEKAIQTAVIAHWAALGEPNTLVAAIPNAGALGQPGLRKGLFDLLVIGPGFVGFMELKAERGRFSAAQQEFKNLLIRAGIPYAICWGRDEPIVALEAWRIVRRRAA